MANNIMNLVCTECGESFQLAVYWPSAGWIADGPIFYQVLFLTDFLQAHQHQENGDPIGPTHFVVGYQEGEDLGEELKVPLPDNVFNIRERVPSAAIEREAVPSGPEGTLCCCGHLRVSHAPERCLIENSSWPTGFCTCQGFQARVDV